MSDDISFIVGTNIKQVVTEYDKARSSIVKDIESIAKSTESMSVKQQAALKKLTAAEKQATKLRLNSMQEERRAREKAVKESERLTRKQEVEERRLNAIKLNSLKMEEQRLQQVARQQAEAAEASARSSRQQAAELDRLKTKFDPLYRASKQYERALEEIEAAYQSGAISKARYTQETARLNTEFNRFTSGVAPAANSLYQFGQNTAFAGKNANRFGMVSQQVGYQVGDFLVQVQSGTNALVAFGQQGTQLAGLLPGVAGAVIGIGLALSTAIGGVVMRQYFNNVSDLKTALRELKDEAKDNADEVERLARGFSSINALRVANEISRLQEEIASLQDSEQISLRQGAALDSQRLNGIRKRIEELKEVLRVTEESARKEQIAALAEDDKQRRRREFLDLLQREVDKIKEREEAEARAASVTAQYMADMMAQLALSKEESEKLADAIFKAWQNGEDLAALSIKDGIDAAAIAAAELARQMGISLGLAQDIVEIGRQGASGPDQAISQVRGTYSNIPGVRQEDIVFQGTFSSGGKTGSSGGGGGSTQQKDPLQQLRERIALETELLGKTEAQKEMIRALGITYNEDYSPKAIEQTRGMVEELIRLQEQQERVATAQEFMANSATDLFLAAAKSTDAFKASLASMLQTLGQAIIKQAFLNALQNREQGQAISKGAGFLVSLFSADGNAFDKGNVVPFARGGVVSQPEFFPMAGGKTGMMGEAGPEAIMPLKRGKDGKLGVASDGRGGTTVVKPVINIDARGAQQGVAEQINAQIAQSLPSIIDATVAASRERSRRGAM